LTKAAKQAWMDLIKAKDLRIPTADPGVIPG
jgi:hypothetical protein